VNEMERVKVAIILVIVISVGIGGVFLLLGGVSSTEFHYEHVYPSGETKQALVSLWGLEDTNVSITFEDNPALLHSLDIELYSAGDIFQYELEDKASYYWIKLEATDRIKSLDLVLGTGPKYEIGIHGTNINSTITYSNGALLRGQQIEYYGSGFLRFVLDEDIDFSTEGLDVLIREEAGVRGDLDLNIDLPEGLNGRVSFDTTSLTIAENEGWAFRSEGHYSTDAVSPQPLLDLLIICRTVVARLSN
jgi:hypothetical protein